jgi:hypothetical protein
MKLLHFQYNSAYRDLKLISKKSESNAPEEAMNSEVTYSSQHRSISDLYMDTKPDLPTKNLCYLFPSPD